MSDEVKLDIRQTCIYGSALNQNPFDVWKTLGDKIIFYKIKKIKCQLKDKKIVGLQCFYQSIDDLSLKPIIDVKNNSNDLTELEYELINEDIVEMRVWLDENVMLKAFEIKTNKGNVKKFGYGEDKELIRISDLEAGDQIIVGFGCYTDGNVVTAIFADYISKKDYVFFLLSGLFCLKYKLKNPDFKKNVDNKLKSMNEKNKLLYRVCLLPDNQYFNIIKYVIA